MSEHQSAHSDILRQILDEFGSAISIHGGSKLLTSDAYIATALAEATKDVSTPFGPTITIASRTGTNDPSIVPSKNVDVKAADKLDMDFYTHSVFGVDSEDPKYVLEGLKHMRYALQPKGIAIIISIKHETGKTEGEDGSISVDLEDKIKYQSRGKLNTLKDVVEYADFEIGKIREFDRSTEVTGKKVDAKVLLARKWDQLSA